ncbi:MAG: fumarylacetoacetase [Paracoccaceae bacterium]|nr:fumarylacetoacetase [Paracoccaceae bacterium]
MLEPSWIESANDPVAPFPLNNLPHCVFSRTGDPGAGWRLGVGIGDSILDIGALAETGVIAPPAGHEDAFRAPSWNPFMAAGPEAWAAFRNRLQVLLSADRRSQDGEGDADGDRDAVGRALVPQSAATLHMPFTVAEYTDFYAGIHHASNVGTMFRGPENALPPNWLHIPIGYNGRASTVVVSGTPVHRPWGQLKPRGADVPVFAPSRRFDIELEMGAVVGLPSVMGQPVSVAEADRMIFGYVILNDWSARDIQAWEYQPLGPFQAKATATTISPWIVTQAALAPFRVPGPRRETELLPYLREPGPMSHDIELDVSLRPSGSETATSIARTNFQELYYSPAQQLCHHTSSGCRMNIGDLLGTGTISGPERKNCGSLLEISWGGKNPIHLQGGEERRFLEDGDSVVMTGWAQGDGYRIGFGTCEGTVHPAIDPPDWAT